MNTYYEIQYRTKEDPTAWFPSTLIANNKFESYMDACSEARGLVYKERVKIRKNRRDSIVSEYRVVEYRSVYTEEHLKTFPISDYIFV